MPKDNSKAARAQRAEDAATRQAARDARTGEQQIAALNKRPGRALAERVRIAPTL